MSLLDLLFPKFCVGCGRWGRYICDTCKKTIRPIEQNEMICPVCEKKAIDGMTHLKCQTKYTIDGLISFFHYDGVVKKVIKEIKYRFVSDVTSYFLSEVPPAYWQRLEGKGEDFIVVPIPLHPSRLRYRGFNQAELFGGYVSKQLNIPIVPSLLTRIHPTIPQVEMKSKDARLQNMNNVFTLKGSVRGTNVFVCDDVFTTGATMREAARILKHGGAKTVWGVTIAR